MFFACGIWCVAGVSNVSPSSELSSDVSVIYRKRKMFLVDFESTIISLEHDRSNALLLSIEI